MNPRPLPQIAMRPMLPTDVPLLAEIFRAAIEELTADDYSAAQQEAWASAADDEEAFGAKLAHELTLVATYGGAAIGFAALADNRRIDMLYVHPAAAGQGAGAMLCDALEKLAAAPNDALAGATPYLRLFGATLGGCNLAGEALAARDVDGGDSQKRYTTLARFFAENISVQAPSLERAVMDSADAVNAADKVLVG